MVCTVSVVTTQASYLAFGRGETVRGILNQCPPPTFQPRVYPVGRSRVSISVIPRGTLFVTALWERNIIPETELSSSGVPLIHQKRRFGSPLGGYPPLPPPAPGPMGKFWPINIIKTTKTTTLLKTSNKTAPQSCQEDLNLKMLLTISRSIKKIQTCLLSGQIEEAHRNTPRIQVSRINFSGTRSFKKSPIQKALLKARPLKKLPPKKTQTRRIRKTLPSKRYTLTGDFSSFLKRKMSAPAFNPTINISLTSKISVHAPVKTNHTGTVSKRTKKDTRLP